MALAPTDANALLSAWRSSNARGPSPASRRVQPARGLSRREAAAVERAALTPAPEDSPPRTLLSANEISRASSPAGGRPVSRGDALQLLRAVTPASALGRSGGVSPRSLGGVRDGSLKAADVNRRRTEGSTRQVQERLRRAADEKAHASAQVHAARSAAIAASPQRLLRRLQRTESAVAEGDRRERGFDLSTHVVRQRDEPSGSITPRNVKADYVNTLASAAGAAKVSPRWLRSHSRPVHGMERLPPIDGTADIEQVTQELQRRSAAKAARRGLPPTAAFTELSEAISAVVVAAKEGRRSPPPRGLCGDTMCYWDRVNVYNRYRESLGPAQRRAAAGK